MNVDRILAEVDVVCLECGARVRRDGQEITCDRGHSAGRLTQGIPDFRMPRDGMEAELVKFWSTSVEYYETSRRLNVDYSDASHESHRALIQSIVDHGATRVLDVGCGSGEFAAHLAERIPGLRYVGIDVSPTALVAADKLERPGVFMAADGERLVFADASFDAVVSLYALEHFPHPERTLDEMARVVRPGGILGLLSISYDRPWGNIPSVRFGAVRGGRKLPRWHPVNLAVYAVNRLRFGSRQLGKHFRYAVDPAYLSFEMVQRPLVLEGLWRPDLDAVHVVSGVSVLRLLSRHGLTPIDSTVTDSRFRGFLVPFDLRIVARKSGP